MFFTVFCLLLHRSFTAIMPFSAVSINQRRLRSSLSLPVTSRRKLVSVTSLAYAHQIRFLGTPITPVKNEFTNHGWFGTGGICSTLEQPSGCSFLAWIPSGQLLVSDLSSYMLRPVELTTTSSISDDSTDPQNSSSSEWQTGLRSIRSSELLPSASETFLTSPPPSLRIWLFCPIKTTI